MFAYQDARAGTEPAVSFEHDMFMGRPVAGAYGTEGHTLLTTAHGVGTPPPWIT